MSRYYELLKEFGYRETQGYGRTSFALSSNIYPNKFHDGRDYAYTSIKNNACKVMMEGKIIYVGFGGKYGRAYGNIVEIEVSPNTFMVYAHLDRFLPLAKIGDVRKVGDDIAIIGKSGTSESTGIHCHLLVRQLGKSVDPKEYIDYKHNNTKPMPEPVKPEQEYNFQGKDFQTRICENYEILLAYPDLFLAHKYKYVDGNFDWNNQNIRKNFVFWWAQYRSKEQFKQAVEADYQTWLKEQGK
jgi:murein DD-endopeptidase MepM/ murein hydrolase activator NlpD